LVARDRFEAQIDELAAEHHQEDDEDW